MKKILCAILCFNNEKTLLKVIKNTKKILNKCDLIFINDGSFDKTNEILFSFNLKTITHKNNLGYGQAMKSAFKYSKKKNYKYLAILPADNQRYVDDLISMSKIIELSGLDMVVGSKYKLLKKIPLQRKLGNIFFSIIAKYFWNSNIRDVLSGFKIYRVNSFHKYLNFLPNDYSFDIVLSLIVSLKKMKIHELDVRCRYGKYTSSMKGIFKIHKKNIFFIGLMMIINLITFFLRYKSKI